MITLSGGHVQNVSNLAVPNGSISLQLSSDAAVIASPFGFVAGGIPITFQFDASGNIAASSRLWSNAELSPSTQYLVNFYDANRSRVNTNAIIWNLQQANGATVDIGTIVPAAAGTASILNAVFFSTVTFSSTAAFAGSTSAAVNSFDITLTGNLTAPTLSGITAGAIVTFDLIQDNVGGRTVVWPTNVKGFQTPISITPNIHNIQAGRFDGTNLYPIGTMQTVT